MALAGLSLAAAPASAGPPFLTDDPVPTDRAHWEIYNFALGSQAAGALSGQAGLDLNYGAAKDLQLTAVIPMDYDAGGRTNLGLGDIELAAKYRLLHQDENGLMPDVAIFPRVFVDSADKRFGSARTSLFLPVWVGKDWGSWSVFGGGGYQINPGPGQRDFWQFGAAVTHALNDRLTLGLEAFRFGRESDDGAPVTLVNLGLLYRFTPHWSLLAAGGPGVENASREGNYNFYVALKADY